MTMTKKKLGGGELEMTVEEPTVVTNSPVEQKEDILIEETVSAPVGKIASDVNYPRSETRKPRDYRISKVPKTTMTYRIQSVDANHNIVWRDVNYAEAMKVAQRTGLPINRN